METDSLTAAIAMVTADVEQAHDAAYVTGHHAENVRRVRAMTDAERVDMLVEKCRDRVTLHRETAIFFVHILRWFAKHPDAKAHQAFDGMVYTPAFARSEFRLARHLHTRICPQAHHWLAQQARHRAAAAPALVLPAAANDANPSSRESAA